MCGEGLVWKAQMVYLHLSEQLIQELKHEVLLRSQKWGERTACTWCREWSDGISYEGLIHGKHRQGTLSLL